MIRGGGASLRTAGIFAQSARREEGCRRKMGHGGGGVQVLVGAGDLSKLLVFSLSLAAVELAAEENDGDDTSAQDDACNKQECLQW